MAAIAAGKHVICEKPLALDADQAWSLLQAAEAAGVTHMCAFNYRFVPAIKLAREIISEGAVGEVRLFRARYLQDWLVDSVPRPRGACAARHAGSGAFGDLGSHIVDLARFLVGEISEVGGATQSFVSQRGGVPTDVDEAFQALVEFNNGAGGVLEASRVSPGRANSLVFEINGTRGSLAFDLERLNELWFYDGDRPRRVRGFQRILVTDAEQPGLAGWWPPGHVLGWEHTFVDELHHFLGAIASGGDIGPGGATFEDGYRAALVCDAILASARSGARQAVSPALFSHPTATGSRIERETT